MDAVLRLRGVAWCDGFQWRSTRGGRRNLASSELINQAANGAFSFEPFRLPRLLRSFHFDPQQFQLSLKLINDSCAGPSSEFFFAAGEILFQITAIAAELLLAICQFSGCRLDFVSFRKQLQPLTFKIGRHIMSRLLQTRPRRLRCHGIANQCVPSFFNDKSLLENLRLSLIQLGTKTSQSLRTVFEPTGKFSERGFLLTNAALAIFDITHDGLTFLFTALLLQPQVREHGIA
jgi:hypothetical protein